MMNSDAQRKSAEQGSSGTKLDKAGLIAKVVNETSRWHSEYACPVAWPASILA